MAENTSRFHVLNAELWYLARFIIFIIRLSVLKNALALFVQLGNFISVNFVERAYLKQLLQQKEQNLEEFFVIEVVLRPITISLRQETSILIGMVGAIETMP